MARASDRESAVWTAAVALLCGCGPVGAKSQRFDRLEKTVVIGNWKHDLRVENLTEENRTGMVDSQYYLKATLSVSNSKTAKSLLYSASRDAEEYEKQYKYLAFDAKDDLCIKLNDKTINPIGYVFEPSNGLSPSERLVYKFQIPADVYKVMATDPGDITYWYTDRLAGVGKICFNVNN